METRWRGFGRGRRLALKEHEGDFRGDAHVLYPDFGGGYMGVYTCQSSSNGTLKIDKNFYM